MRNWIVGTVWGIAVASGTGAANAQPVPSIDSVTGSAGLRAPTAKYPLMPQYGEYLILVKAYKDNKRATVSAQTMAEELAEHIRAAHRWPAFIEVRNWAEKVAEEKRVQAEKDRLILEYKRLNMPVDGVKVPIRRNQIELEYAVFAAPQRGTWKDMDAAHRGLEEMRKWTAPPENLCDKIERTTEREGISSLKVVNPFTTLSFVVRNPLVPHDLAAEHAAAEREEDEVLRKINDGQEFNLFKCPKKYTLVVKRYDGSMVLQSANAPPSVASKAFGDREKSSLDGGGRSAEEFARVLKDPRMKLGLKPYVLHTRGGSLVCLGEFDALNDAAMNAAKAKIATLQVADNSAMGASKMGGLGLIEAMAYKIPGR